jgi:hypothetical protein
MPLSRRALCFAGAGLPLFLSGCISLPNLDKEARSTADDMALSVLKDPCTSPEAIFSTSTGSLANLAANFAPSEQMSDLDLGRAIVQAAAAAPAALTTTATGVSMDLAQFAEDDALVSPTAASIADIASSGVLAQMQRELALSGRGSPQQQLVVRRADWEKNLDEVADATSTYGWSSSFETALGRYAKTVLAGPAIAGAELQALEAEVARKYLLAAYFKAYFRNGQILSVSITSDALKKGLKEKLEKTIKDPNQLKAVKEDIDSLGDDIVTAVCGSKTDCVALGLVGETTFVTRAGKSYGFPGISATIDPFADKKISTNKIDSAAVIGDLVRVFFEAGGDYFYGVPAVTKSTACEKWKPICATEAQGPLIKRVNEAGDRAEAAARSATAIAIRGGWILALNNEALATSIETGASVTIRKSVEAAAWSILSKKCPAVAPTGVSAVNIRIV